MRWLQAARKTSGARRVAVFLEKGMFHLPDVGDAEAMATTCSSVLDEPVLAVFSTEHELSRAGSTIAVLLVW